MYDTIVFVDFDGTVTSEETLAGSLRHMDPPPEGAEEIERKLATGELTLKEAVTSVFSSVRSDRVGEFTRYINSVPFRKGFDAFLDTLGSRGIPVVIVSGGLDIMVEEKLAPYRDKLADIWDVKVDLSGAYFRLVAEPEGELELIDKVAIMDKYAYRRAICVGDGYTDILMAQKADVVYARDELANYLDAHDMPYRKWGDFYDIVKDIENNSD
ncbi:MAG: HAD-IB family phosphatase [Clostridiales Family XIII bacterium]|jgi:2-hydroxy-3-keto-5-methylthiopentenyl-1-phosphate phosphatase|nr:HAD-IB family phosphatase [Clostridiales Family XIII bacterium]